MGSDPCGGECPCEAVAAAVSIDIDDIAGEIEARNDLRFHRRRIDGGCLHAARGRHRACRDGGGGAGERGEKLLCSSRFGCREVRDPLFRKRTENCRCEPWRDRQRILHQRCSAFPPEILDAGSAEAYRDWLPSDDQMREILRAWS